MNFLAPLFLFGAAAVALPIVFHLLRRSAREKVPFSSLIFLTASPPKITRRSRLEHIFLLLVRCLVLLLLAFGFARPFFSEKGGITPEAAELSQFVLLVDTSASMRREGVWDAALARADRVLRRVGPADEVAILTFDRQTENVVTFEQWIAASPNERAAIALALLKKQSPGWSGTHLGPALTIAAELLESNAQDKEFASRQIVLISDLQEGSHFEGLQGYDWPHGVQLVLESIKPDSVTNAGLQLVAESDTFQSAAQTAFRVRVSNAADSRREQFQVRWKPMIGAEESTNVYVPPGQSRTVTIPTPENGVPVEQVRLTGDDHSFDNVLFYVPTRAERIEILYFGAENETNPNEPLYYLKRAFQETRRQSIVVVPHSGDSAPAPFAFANARMAVVTGRLSDEAVQSVQKYLEAGNTVVMALKTPELGGTLAKLVGLGAIGIEEATGHRYAMLGEIQFDHPLFRPFTDPRYSDFTKIHFWKYRRIDATALPNATVLARFDTGDPAWVEISRGKGKLLVLTSGWHPADSQLALSSKFVPLLYSVLEQTVGLTAQKFAYTIGDAVEITTTNASPSSVKVRKPDATEVALSGSDPFAETGVPGVYSVIDGSLNSTQRFAINLDPYESKTAPLQIEELERIGLPFHDEAPKSKPEVEQNRREILAVELEKQQQLWRWLILGALVVLFAETWMSARFSRAAANISA